jgi:hypothetical protein
MTDQRTKTEMDAFDQLPAAVREAVRNAPYGVSAPMLLDRLQRGRPEQGLMELVEKSTIASRQLAIERCGVPPETLPQPKETLCESSTGAGPSAPLFRLP